MGWLITLGILFLLAILPLGASVKYDDAGPLVRIIAGPIRFTVFPMKKKDKPQKKAAKKAGVTPEPEPAPVPEPPMTLPQEKLPDKGEKKEKKGGSVLDFLPLVKIAFDFLGDFRRKLRLNCLELKIILAGDDPCDLATNYGRAWAGVGNLMPKLEKWFVIKKRDIDVECDFTSNETKIYARLDITITLGRIIGLVVVYAVKALASFLKINKKRKQSKGGAENESESSQHA